MDKLPVNGPDANTIAHASGAGKGANLVEGGKLRSLKIWVGMLVATVVAIAVSIRWLDAPVALALHPHAGRYSGLGNSFDSSILVRGEIIVIAALAIARLAWGTLPAYARALFLASCASLIAFEANEYILKVIFGRKTPVEFLQAPAAYPFNLLQGDDHSSFPSGHMVMATTFAVVIGRNIPGTAPFLITMLGFGAFALLLGDWHFVSDTLAGAFVGWTAGLMATRIWNREI
ncbi:MAG TPA: phosphatase PAP2 family protein [Rhizomicrobium sp.]|jgi:membrane-associated phospholipid phosphatase